MFTKESYRQQVQELGANLFGADVARRSTADAVAIAGASEAEFWKTLDASAEAQADW